MRQPRVILSVFVGAAPLLFMPWTSPPIRTASFLESEQRRLRAHFDSVDNELMVRTVHAYSDSQQRARSKLVLWLRKYRDAGQFPRNVGQSDRETPIFRDRDGTLCAMAYLINRSGRRDLVDRIARTHNLAYIRELPGDTALLNWLDANGLSATEAGRIQPTYGPSPGAKSSTIPASRLWTSAALLGADATTAAFMLTKPSNRSVIVGLLGGAAALALGNAHLDDAGNAKALAQGTTAVGAITTGIALWRAVTPNSWYRHGPFGRAANVLTGVRPSPVLEPTGSVVPGLAWQATFR